MKPRPYSLLRLITIRLVLVAFMAGLIQTALVMANYIFIDPNELIHHVLSQEAKAVAARLTLDEKENWAFQPDGDLSERYQRYKESYAFQVISVTDGSIPAASHADSGNFPPDWSHAGEVSDGLETASFRFTISGRPVRIAVAMRDDPQGLWHAALWKEFASHVAGPMVMLLIVSLFASILAIHHALTPLVRISQAVSEMDPAKTSVHLPEQDIPKELLPIVQTIIKSFTRLGAVLKFQRDFTADVAHELRTPLSAISLHLERLPEESAAPLREDSRRLIRQVNQLLKVAQLEALQTEPMVSIDLAEIARDVGASLALFAIDAGCEVEVEDLHPAPVAGHRDAVTGALINLVENAIRVSSTGSAITVTAGPGPHLSVKDRGPGFPADHRDRLTQRFAQGGTRQRGSAGLGLSLVARTMELHDGHFTIADRPDGGSIVTLRFPA